MARVSGIAAVLEGKIISFIRHRVRVWIIGDRDTVPRWGDFLRAGGGRPQVGRAAAASRIAAAWLFFSLARAAYTFLRGARCKVFVKHTVKFLDPFARASKKGPRVVITLLARRFFL